MIKGKKRNNKKRFIITALVAALVCVAVAGILITNLFIPVKYLSAYINFTKEERTEGSRISFIGLPSGESVLVEFSDGKTMLIDGGDGSLTGEKKILKLLNKRGISVIDYLVCTSVEAPRSGGLSDIIKYKTVKSVYMPYCIHTHINSSFRTFSEEVEKSKAAVSYCSYGGGERGEDYYFYFLSPSPPEFNGGEYDKLNAEPSEENVINSSAVIWLNISGVSFLILGGAGSGAQEKLLNDYFLLNYFEIGGNKVKLTSCNVLSLARGGSEAGVCERLIKYLSPDVAVISSYKQPSLSAISAVQPSVGDRLYRTDLNSTVTFTVNGKYNITTEK